jgi:cell wall-associated NlpC family hydrolase
MSPSLHRARIMTAVAAVPVGIAAAFALQAPAASAAPDASSHQAGITRLTAAGQQQRLTSSQRLRQRLPARLRAYYWAARQKGHPYVYGGTGPGFDCSGLVMEAYRHVGIWLPRTTTQMLASRKLVWVRHPRMGDLAFYGSGHVELFRRWGYTFGAHDYGTPVGLIHYGYGWKPTAFYHVR